MGDADVGQLLECHKVLSHDIQKVDHTKFKKLTKQFEEIADQMNSVGGRIEVMHTTLLQIDKRFDKCTSAENKMGFKSTPRQCNRLEQTANELITSCDVYLGLIEKELIPTKSIENLGEENEKVRK